MFIEIKNAKKHYGEGEALIKALDDVSLSLDEGKIYVILGPSGSGKSTLLNMIGGLDSLDSGNIVISGRNISDAGKKQLTDVRI
jgi:putative ABC transport system ATP-binding protein